MAGDIDPWMFQHELVTAIRNLRSAEDDQAIRLVLLELPGDPQRQLHIPNICAEADDVSVLESADGLVNPNAIENGWEKPVPRRLWSVLLTIRLQEADRVRQKHEIS